LKRQYGVGSLRQTLLGYVVGAWALLEIVVTVSDLAGLPLAVPRSFVLLLAGGLVMVSAVAVAKEGVRAMQERSDSKDWEGRLGWFKGPTILFGLLPGSFILRISTTPGPDGWNGSLEWIMWRDAPLFAAACAAIAVGSAIAWRVSARLASDRTDTGRAPNSSGPAI
jgi:hypothetical protein